MTTDEILDLCEKSGDQELLAIATAYRMSLAAYEMLQPCQSTLGSSRITWRLFGTMNDCLAEAREMLRRKQ